MKTVIAAAISLSLVASAAVAGTLPSGKPAGVRTAQMIDTSTIVLVAAGAAIIGAAVAISDNGSGTGPAVTTTSAVTTTNP